MGNRLFISPILSGIITILAILFCLSLILSLILHLSSIHEASVQLILLPLTCLTLFVGGCVSGYKSGSKGWYFGGLTGLTFLLIAWFISFLGFDALITMKQGLFYLAYLLLSMIGGIVGVNISPNRS